MRLNLTIPGLLKRKFTQIYDSNSFHGDQSFSGRGSDLDQTRVVESMLPKLFKSLAIESILDVPCGDQNWLRRMDIDFMNYTGVDIVSEIIELNSSLFGSNKKKYVCLDVTQAVPPISDLVLCRDLLVHLDTRGIRKALRNIKASGATYLLTTTFTDDRNYKNLPVFTKGVGWRPINFNLDPFNFPQPIKIINEGCTEGEGRFQDKSLALWKLSELNI